MKRKIILIVSLAALVLFSGCSEIETKPNIEIGTITDFEVSAGGFGTPSKAVVEVNNNSKYYLDSLYSIKQLRTGRKLCALEGMSSVLMVRVDCNE